MRPIGVNQLAGLREGAVLIGFGTSIPASTRKIGADLAAKGAGMIGAPLGRTPAHAKEGKLNIMAAGDRATFHKVKPVLDQQGENVFYLGALGAGHTTKLLNHSMGMTTVAAMSQAFAVADLAEEDRQQLFPIHGLLQELRGGRCEQVGFSIANKDPGYFLQMVENLGTRAQIAEGTAANLQAAVAAGMGSGHVPEIFDHFKTLKR